MPGGSTSVTRLYSLAVEKSFKEFYGRYQNLIEKYQGSVKEIVNDSFPRFNWHITGF